MGRYGSSEDDYWEPTPEPRERVRLEARPRKTRKETEGNEKDRARDLWLREQRKLQIEDQADAIQARLKDFPEPTLPKRITSKTRIKELALDGLTVDEICKTLERENIPFLETTVRSTYVEFKLAIRYLQDNGHLIEKIDLR